MSIIETEVWKPNPERPGTIIFDSYRIAQDIFNKLESHLKADGRMPDEYFLFDSHDNWRDGAVFPKDAEIRCNVNYGGSEGIYLDITVRHKKDVYERSQQTGELGWVNRYVTETFATGKTLGDTIDDLDKMNLVASSVMAAFYGFSKEIEERYAKIENGEVELVYPRLLETQKANESVATAEKLTEKSGIMSSHEHLEDNNLNRFMDVDVLDFLSKISDKVMVNDPESEIWNNVKEALSRVTSQDGFENKRIIWHIGSETSRLRNECEIFVKGSRAFEYEADIEDFDTNTLVYAIEFTKREDKTIIGNVFEVGSFPEHANRVRDMALPLDSVVIAYQDAWGNYSGKKITVSPELFEENRSQFTEKGGKVVSVQFNPKDETALNEILQQERAVRMAYPIGNTEEHLKKLDEKLSESQMPPEEQELSEYENDGQRVIPAVHLPEGWEWRMYDDGSGGLYSPDNKSVVEVDFATSEYKQEGKWHFMSGYPYETISSGEFMENKEKAIRGSIERNENKPKTLEEKMQAAKEKVKAQDTQSNDNKARKRDERE